jgi:branched-chain amino acid aminotransferase
VTKTKTPKPLPAIDPISLAFGLNDTDHMLTILWDAKKGWGKPEIKPLAPL